MDHRQAIQAAMAAAAGEQPPPQIVPRHYHWLLQLPPRFWSEMHYYLDYPEILALRCLSKQFNEQRVEEFLPWTVRHAFVARLEEITDHRQLRSACYLCFRIRGNDQFYRMKNKENKEDMESMPTHARVMERDWYRGTRKFKVVPAPSPDQQFASVDPPSPLGAASSFFLPRGGAMPQMGGNMSMGVPINASMDASMGGGMGLVPVPMGGGMQAPFPPMRIPITTMMLAQRVRWRPRAPGADVGKVESLRRYCTECAIKTEILTPGELVTIAQRDMWLCRCHRLHRKEENMPCPGCGMNPVYRA